ncbi:MAG: TIGR00730 family Rossman fold protein [Proteobacteria bacterium]|nr:TIGR00730 family Rossman fold protein [Pseudomonadota bacterium]
MFRRICVFCGSSNHADPLYFEAARRVGELLAKKGIGIVFGGGRIGMMGVLADAALAAGGEVIGVIPRKLMDVELGHEGCTEMFVVNGMPARKAMMIAICDAFIALPGGYGTLEEMFEAVTLGQLQYHDKPVGLLNVNGYYDTILDWAKRAVDDSFISTAHYDILVSAAEPEELLKKLEEARYPSLDKWIADP